MDFFRGAFPLEKICRFVLNEKFSKFLNHKVTRDQLSLDVTLGTLTVTDIDLNPSIFNNGRKALTLRAAKIGSVQIQIAGKVPSDVCTVSAALWHLSVLQAAKSFFSDTVLDNLNVKVSDLSVELDITIDRDNDEVPKESGQEVRAPTLAVFSCMSTYIRTGHHRCHASCDWSISNCTGECR
jgi:hypothetical protein